MTTAVSTLSSSPTTVSMLGVTRLRATGPISRIEMPRTLASIVPKSARHDLCPASISLPWAGKRPPPPLKRRGCQYGDDDNADRRNGIQEEVVPGNHHRNN